MTRRSTIIQSCILMLILNVLGCKREDSPPSMELLYGEWRILDKYTNNVEKYFKCDARRSKLLLINSGKYKAIDLTIERVINGKITYICVTMEGNWFVEHQQGYVLRLEGGREFVTLLEIKKRWDHLELVKYFVDPDGDLYAFGRK